MTTKTKENTMYNLKNTKIDMVSAEDGKSMDWAKEYGFRDHDGAKRLYKNALGLI
jgi:hypothetical protein